MTDDLRKELAERIPLEQLIELKSRIEEAGERRKVEESLFYIQNVGFCGNCLKWWRPLANGYTADLKEAGKFTTAEAIDICRNRPKEDIAWLASEVDAMAQIHVTCLTGVTRLTGGAKKGEPQ